MEEIKMAVYEIKENKQYNSIEVYFKSKPEEQIRIALKQRKMRWNPKKGCWYGFIERNQLALILGSQNNEAVIIPETSFVDGNGLYDGWEGGNNKEWNSRKELKELLRADFKKAGIKATIRFEDAGYLIAITCTLTINAMDIKNREEWEEHNQINFNWGDRNNYEDENGEIQVIFGDELNRDPITEEEKALHENIKATNYKLEVEHITGSYHNGFDEMKILKGKAKRDYDIMKAIVTSYNRDCSNGQIDYFNRSIYEYYEIKVVGKI
jgi:hypothetical protein